MTQAQKSKWYDAQCALICTREDKQWQALVESMRSKWPMNMTEEDRIRTDAYFNKRALADIYYGR